MSEYKTKPWIEPYGVRYDICNTWTKDLGNNYLPYIPPVSIVGNYTSVYDENNWISSKGRIYNIPKMTFKHLGNTMRVISDLCGELSVDKNKYIVYQNLKKELLSRV